MWRNPNNIASDSEQESESVESGDLAHISIPIAIPLENLCISTMEPSVSDPNNPQGNSMGDTAIESLQKQILQLSTALNNVVASQQQSDAARVMQNRLEQAQTLEAFYRIPDPIKIIPSFDGNKKQLFSWIQTVENALNLFKDRIDPLLYEVYVDAVKNKIIGKARDIISAEGNPQNFEEVKNILIKSLGDRKDLSFYMSKLWLNKMGSRRISEYYTHTKELIQKVKVIAKQNEKYKYSWDAINEFIDETSLAAFVAGLNDSFYGYVQAAQLLDLESTYAFLCKFESFPMEHKRTYRQQSSGNNGNTNRVQESYNKNGTRSYDYNSTDPSQPQTSKSFFQVRSPNGMDTSTTKTRLTINRNEFNNNETFDCKQNDEGESDKILVNFWEASTKHPPK